MLDRLRDLRFRGCNDIIIATQLGISLKTVCKYRKRIGLPGGKNRMKPGDKMKQVYTTGEIAKICHVAPRTVSKWFDSGKIPGGYRIPGSLDRRVPRAALAAFLQRHGMPFSDECDVLLVGLPVSVVMALREALPAARGFSVSDARNGFDAGLMAAEGVHTAILDVGRIGRGESIAIARSLSELGAKRLIAIIAEDETDLPGLLAAGFAVAYASPANVETLVTDVEEHTHEP
jgi:hypothetical protein